MNGQSIMNSIEDRLDFLKSATSAFEFLFGLGFKKVEREATSLHFESPFVFIDISHDRLSYEIGLEVGLISTQEVFSLFEILSVVAPSEVDKAMYQASDPKILERCLVNVAGIVQHKLTPLLKGDSASFENLRHGVSLIRRATTLRAQFGAIISHADNAWESKDFETAKELYQKAQEALDETRLRRLGYLRKMGNEPRKA